MAGSADTGPAMVRNVWAEVAAMLGTLVVVWSRSLPAGIVAVLTVTAVSGYGFCRRGHTVAVFCPPSNGWPAVKSAAAAWSPTVVACALMAVAMHAPTWLALGSAPLAAAFTWLEKVSSHRWWNAHVVAVPAQPPEPGQLWWAWVPFADLLDGKVRPVKVQAIVGDNAVVHTVTSTRPAPQRASQFVQLQIAPGRTSYLATATRRLPLGLLRDPMRAARGRPRR